MKLKIILVVFSFLLSSCNLFIKTTPGQVKFDRESVSRYSRSISTGDESYNISIDDDSLQTISDEYASYGKKLGSYTPTRFELYIQRFSITKAHQSNLSIIERVNSMYNPVSLENPMTYATRDKPEIFTADFINEVTLYPNEDFQNQVYDGILISFNSDRVNYAVGAKGTHTFPHKVESMITVHVPGYEDVWDERTIGTKEQIIDDINREVESNPGFSTIDPSDFDIIDETRSLIKNPDGSYSFGLGHIKGERELFFDLYSDKNLFINGGETNSPLIVIPFQGIDVSKSAAHITVMVIWDLENIIELYDNNSPNKEDHILVIAEDYWKRLKIDISVD